MARFSASRIRLQRTGRKTFWLGGVITNTVLASANTAVLITQLNAAALALRPFTIVRTRGYWGMFSDQTAADEDQHVHVGGIVVTEQASAVGVSAVPTPVTQDFADWFLFDGAAQRFEQQSAVGIQPNMLPHRYTLDSKAMRKVSENEDIVFVIQNGALGEGSTVVMYTKLLIKLH